MPDRFELLITKPLPSTEETARVAVSARTTALSWSTALPGGFDGCDIGLQNDVVDTAAWLASPVNAGHRSHVAVSSEEFTCFEGRVYRLDRSDAGLVRALSARGYGIAATADGQFSAANGTGATSGTVFQSALAQAAPLLSINTSPAFWLDPGIAHVPADFDSRTPAQIAEQLQREGGLITGTAGTVSLPWDFSVWEGRLVQFLPRLQPDPLTVPIVFPVSSVISWTEDSSAMFGALGVTYTSGTTKQSLPPVVQFGWIDQYGALATSWIDLGSGATANGAAQYQLTQLAVIAAPKVSISVNLNNDTPAPTPFGGSWPSWTLRAGQWCMVGEQGPFLIISTNYDASQKNFSATLQTYPDHYLQRIHDMWQAQQLLKAGLNLNSAAPA